MVIFPLFYIFNFSDNNLVRRRQEKMESSSEALIRAVEDAKRRCEALKHRIQTLNIQSLSSSNWKITVLKLVNSELSFLNRYSIPPASSLNINPHSSLSVNIGHLESVVHILQQPSITGVSRVCKSIPLFYPQEELKAKGATCSKSIHLDIVCCLNGNPVWFIISDRNPKYISWHASSGNKGLRTRVEEVLAAAQSSETLRPSSVILFFSNGLKAIVHKKLQDEFGAVDLGLAFPYFDCVFYEESEDDWINVFARSYNLSCALKIETYDLSKSLTSTSRTACEVRPTDLPILKENTDAILDLGDSLRSLVCGMKCCVQDVEQCLLNNLCNGHIDLVNFDTTALIAIVSGISNGGINKLLATPESKLRSKFKCNYEFVIAQVNSEIRNRIHEDLSAATSGKGGIICESVYSEFQELVSMCGGKNEKLRANFVLKHLRVVPDCPSSRLASLPTTRKLALKNKVAFGTGDHWCAPTLTANLAFIRAVSQRGMPLFTVEHRPRALIGD